MSGRPYAPLAPFDSWPEHWVFEGGYVWVCLDPAAIVTQFCSSVPSAEEVNGLHDVLDEIVRSGFTVDHPGFLMFHDWRTIESVDPSTVRAWERRARRPGRPFAQRSADHTVLRAGLLGSLVGTVIRNAVLLNRFVFGGPDTTFSDDVQSAIRAARLRAPPAHLPDQLRRR